MHRTSTEFSTPDLPQKTPYFPQFTNEKWRSGKSVNENQEIRSTAQSRPSCKEGGKIFGKKILSGDESPFVGR